ncbi:MAG: hypothetical protein M1511_15955 [Deltaproteobacteria bacterium]|nr:hypothetical protein [Deltaproteobacteria bacterium]
MSKESLIQDEYLSEFTCPKCGGHTLRADVVLGADVTHFEDEEPFYEIPYDQEHYIMSYWCGDCFWETKEQSVVMNHMKSDC